MWNLSGHVECSDREIAFSNWQDPEVQFVVRPLALLVMKQRGIENGTITIFDSHETVEEALKAFAE